MNKSGINWFEETVGNTEQQTSPDQPKESQNSNGSGINWFDETVLSENEFVPADKTLDAPAADRKLTIKGREEATTNELGLSVKPESEKGFIEKVDDRFTERGQAVAETATDVKDNKISLAEGIVQAGGSIAGAYFDALGQIIASSGKTLYEMLPDELEEATGKAASKAKEAFLGTELGQQGLAAAESGIKQYSAWKKEHPRAAKNLEAATNIALFFTPKLSLKGKKTPLGKASDSLKRGADKKQEVIVRDLVLPQEAKKVKSAAATARTIEVDPISGKKTSTPRTTVSPITQKKTIQPSPFEVEMIKEVSKVPGIRKPGVVNTVQNSINKTQTYLDDVTREFEKRLVKTGVSVNSKDVTNRIMNAIEKAKNDGLFIVGSGEEVAIKLEHIARRIIEKHTNPKTGRISGEGLLFARREIDDVFETQAKIIFNADSAQTARTTLSRATRQEVNEILDDSVRLLDPGFNTATGRRQQSLLIKAIDNMGPKAADEGSSLLGRAWQGAAKITKSRSDTANVLAILTGTTVLNALTQYSSAISTGIGVGILGYSAGKLVTTQMGRRGMAGLLGMMDDAIKVALSAKDAVALGQLKADRAAILELIKNVEIVEDDEFKGLTIPITKDATQSQEQ